MDTTRQDFGHLDRTTASQFMGSAGLHPSAGLLMTPSGFLDAHHAQSAGGTGGLLRTGLPELGRSGPPHATPAGSVSTPSPVSQCQGRYYSSLSINTGGSNYAYLHGNTMAGSMPPPSPSPFRTPPGLPTVRHHWSHTPPPSLDSYGRYGLGASLYSLYPMLSSTEASTFCMQASAAARLLQKSSPYHHLFGTRELGLYHHAAGLSIGSPYSPTLGLDPMDLGGTSAANDMERAGTPLDFMCKSANSVHNCPPLLPVKRMQTTSSHQDLRCTSSTSSSGSSSIDVGKPETSEPTKQRPAKESRESANANVDTKSGPPSEAMDTATVTRTTPSKSNHNNGAASFSSRTSCSPCETSSRNSNASKSTTCKDVSRSSTAADRLRKSENHKLKPEIIKSEFQRKNDSCRRLAQQQCNRETEEKLMSTVNQTIHLNSVQVQALNLTRDAKSTSSSSPLPLKVNANANVDCKLAYEKRRRENEQQYHRYLYPFSLPNNSCETTKNAQVPLGSATETPFCDTKVRVKQEKRECSTCHFKSSVAPSTTQSEEQPMALTTSSSCEVRPKSPNDHQVLKDGTGGRRDCRMMYSDISRKDPDYRKSALPGQKCLDQLNEQEKEIPLSSKCKEEDGDNKGSNENNTAEENHEQGTTVTAEALAKSCAKQANRKSPVSVTMDLSLSTAQSAVKNICITHNNSTKPDAAEVVAAPTMCPNNLQNTAQLSPDDHKETTATHLAGTQFKSSIITMPSSQSHQEKLQLPSSAAAAAAAAAKTFQSGYQHSISMRLPQQCPQECAITTSSPLPMPYDYTTKIKTKDLVSATCTTTVTTTTPATSTTVSLSSSTFQGCFSQHVHRAMASVMPSNSSSPPLPSQTLDSASASTAVSSSSSTPEQLSPLIATTSAVSTQIAGTATVKKTSSALQESQLRTVATAELAPTLKGSKVGSNHTVPSHIRGQASNPSKSRSDVIAVKVSSSLHATVANKKTDEGILKALPSSRVSCPSKLNSKSNKSPAPNIVAKPAESCSAETAIFTHTLANGSSTIPIGIAVARQRQDCHTSTTHKQRSNVNNTKDINLTSPADPLSDKVNRPEQKDFLREQTELQQCHEKTPNGQPVPTTDFNSNVMVAGTTTSTACWDDANKSGTSLQTRWMPTAPHGHNVSQALWLGQAPFAATPAPVSMQISSVEHSHLQFPPLGYQLARDQITNHLFLIPTANLDVMERPPIWPAFAATAATTAPQLQPHHNPFQPFIFQQQQQLLQQDSQRTTIEFRLQQDPSSAQEAAKDPDIPISNTNDAETGNTQGSALMCQSIKEEAAIRSEDFKEKATLSLAPSSSIIADIPVSGQAFPYVIPAPNALPYFFDPQTATAVVHVTPATSSEPLHVEASEKRSQGTSPVPCSDICLTPPSDSGGIQTSDCEMESESEKIMGVLLQEDDMTIIKPEPLMADACNQTETPPMTDEEDEDDEDEEDTSNFEDEDENMNIKDRSNRSDGKREKSPSRVVKVEDMSVQCELLDELYDIQPDSTETKPNECIDVHGLELLSNIIEEHQENYHGAVSNSYKSLDAAEPKFTPIDHNQKMDKSNKLVENKQNTTLDLQPDSSPQKETRETSENEDHQPEMNLNKNVTGEMAPTETINSVVESTAGPLAVNSGHNLGGLGLLCALAEQRILQETLDSDSHDAPHEHEIKDAANQKIAESKDCEENRVDSVKDAESETTVDINKKSSKSQKEFKDFIAHKMMQYASPGNKSPQTESSDMDSAELQMRMRLAELQKKYKEKQKELAKLLPKKEKDTTSVSGSIKRGPGRPRKRKFLPLYETKLTKLHFDNKLKSSNKKDRHLLALQSLISGVPSKKSHQHSSSKVPKMATSTGKLRPILKPAVLKPQKASTSMDWLSNNSTALSNEKLWSLSPLSSPASKNISKPSEAASGVFNFLSGASQNKVTVLPSPGETLKISPSIVLKCIAMPVVAPKLAPQVSRLLSNKGTASTPEESTTETSDSDDSSYYLSGKCAPKSSQLMKEVLIKASKRKDLLKNNKSDSKKNYKGDDDDSTELSISFSSLSVSCTMPPFQGCEEPSGLGLLAKYASQVVEHSSNLRKPSDTTNAITITPLNSTSSSTNSGNRPASSANVTANSITIIPTSQEQDTRQKDEPLSEVESAAPLEQDATSSSHKRKPGRPKKHSPIKAKEATETIVAKQPKPMNFMKMNSKQGKRLETVSTKSSMQTETKYSFLEDEAWLRRRSERIFLNEPRVNPGSTFQMMIDSSLHRKSTSLTLTQASIPSSTQHKPASDEGSLSSSSSSSCVSSTWKSKSDDTQKKSIKPASKFERFRTKKRPNKSKSDESQFKKLKTKLTKNPKEKITEDQLDDLREQCQLQAHDAAGGLSPNPSAPDSPENSSFSEGDNLPLSQLIERPATPEPRSCIIKAEELQDRMRVLTMMDGLFYAGFINAIRAPDVYGITIDGERGNRPHIYSREEILQEAIIEVKPRSLRYLPEGTRVCAFWSQQYRCLYPGTVAKSGSPNPSPDKNCVNVEFDDGDSGRIPIDNIRLLPPGLPIISYEPDPLILGKRRTKSTGDLSREKRTIVPLNDDAKETENSQTSPSKSLRKKSPIKSSKGKLNASENVQIESPSSGSSGSCKVVSKKWGKTNGNLSPHSKQPPTASELEPSDLKIADSAKDLISPKTESKRKEPNTSQILESSKSKIQLPSNLASTANPIPNNMGSGRITTTFTTMMGTTTISSSSSALSGVVAMTSSSSSSNKNASSTAPLSSPEQTKPKKHKKHRDRTKPEEKRHHHHHHHHHHHKHKRKHEKQKHDDKVSSENFHVPKSANTIPKSLPTSTSLVIESKKSELTLKIKTNNVDLNQVETEEEMTMKDNITNSKENDEGLSSNQSEDKDDYSESSTDDHSEKLEDNAPAVKKAKMTNNKSENNQKPTPKAKGKERSNSVESKSKIAAFLPARQIWRWSGKSFRRPGTKGKAKKEFYKSITRGKEIINVGDCAVFLSTGRPHLPYIGRIIMMWESWGGNMIVKVKWFYHPEETKGGRRLADNKGALYQSFHVDENDVQTISHKCEVLSWEDYKTYKAHSQNKYSSHYDNNNDTYYLAGMYDPTTGVVTLEPGVS